MDSPSEEGFDRLTRIASRALEVPVAFISLLDRERQFFKSDVGLTSELRETREVPVSRSFCQHVVCTGEDLVIGNARDDPDFADHPAVTGFGVAAYLGVPLCSPDGHVLGTFCVIDREPRDWTPRDVEIVQDLAGAASTELELRRARDEAREATRSKSEFMTMLSHELRTPLNAIVGYAELMEMGIPEPLPEALEPTLRNLLLSTDHQRALVEELLTFSRLESGREVVEPDVVPLERFVDEVRAIIGPLAERSAIELEVSCADDLPRTVETDPRKVRQILVNLLGNAVKFTPEGGRVGLAIRRDGERLALEVWDTGMGISEDQLDRAFEAFWQADRSDTREAGGTGLGLAIVGRFTAMLGGSVDVESSPGEGSRFTVRLPLVFGARDGR